MNAVVLSEDCEAVVIHSERAVVVTQPGGETVVVQQPEPPTVVVTRGIKGDKGDQGTPGPVGGTSVARLAGETISALRAVYELDGEIFNLDYRDEDHIDLLLGITLTAGVTGATINVQRFSDITDAAWSWTPGRVFLGADGTLTQSPAADGFDVLIGSAVSATRLTINLQDPIRI